MPHMAPGSLSGSALLARDTILQKSTEGIPTWMLHVMSHPHLERIANVPPGTYQMQPDETYLAAQKAIGTCMLDQWLSRNPLTMGAMGFDEALGVTPSPLQSLPYTPVDLATGSVRRTGSRRMIRLNDMEIDSPEAVVQHLEDFVFPRILEDVRRFDEDARVAEIIARERALQSLLGPSILKTGYSFVYFPYLYYGVYGYDNYLSAYALYPEVMERHFRLQGDYALLNNRAAARAYREGNLPPYHRLDHDMADSRGTLVSLKSLEQLWFPHFSRCLEPMRGTDVRMVWHCDGNLMGMLPGLLAAGIRGFQGFQYEDGMDYQRICAMKAVDGQELLILAGVSVTTTLPFGCAADVRRELRWLVEEGPRSGLFLGVSSSITPDTPWGNLETLIQGLRYYREHGRA
jgi:hypothetical protein